MPQLGDSFGKETALSQLRRNSSGLQRSEDNPSVREVGLHALRENDDIMQVDDTVLPLKLTEDDVKRPFECWRRVRQPEIHSEITIGVSMADECGLVAIPWG